MSVTIDGQTVSVPEGTLVVEAAKAAGVDVPVYCYHPKMDPVGMCRICLVEIERFPKLQIACATRVSEGMVVRTQSEKAADGRKGVLEFLLLNHPLDCPICDKGGECDLQDYTMSYGPGQSRLTEPKLHKPKRVDLGPTIVLDEERCILCRRCTRFDDEIAQEANLVIDDRGYRSLIATRDGEPYASYFSGNTTEICPVGALTSKAYRFRSRPWDLAHADSVCTQCSVGCNFRIDSRFGRVMRTMIRENPAIDGGWLCDRGRYTFNYLYEPARLRAPRVRVHDGAWTETTFDAAVEMTAQALRKNSRVGVIGGGRLSDEEAFALQRFARDVLGTNDIDYRVHLQRFASPARFGAKLTDIDDASLVLVFGAVPAEQAPILDLRLRRAVARCGARLVHAGPFAPRFTVPAEHVPVAPGDIAALMRRLADTVHKGEQPRGTADDPVADLSAALAAADKIVVIHNGRDAEAIEALDGLMQTLHGFGHPVGVLVVGSQGNARGAEAAGCVPNLGPGYYPVQGPPGRTTLQMLRAAVAGELDALLIVGANPALTFPDGALVRSALERVPFVAVVDQVMTETAHYADVVFAAAAFAEKRGHVTNLEGRAQEFAQAVEAPVQCRTDAELLAALAAALHKPVIDADPDALFAQLRRVADGGSARPAVDAPANPPKRTAEELLVIPVPKLYMGGGAAAHDPGLAPMRPPPFAVFNPADASRLGLADGDRATLTGIGGAIDVIAEVSDGPAAGSVLVVADLPEAPVNRLLDASGFGVASATRAAVEVTA